jgi:hypothetical protein
VAALVAGVVGATPWLPALGRRLAHPEAEGRGGTLSASVSSLATLGLWVVLAGCVMLIAARTYNPFIYFRF